MNDEIDEILLAFNLSATDHCELSSKLHVYFERREAKLIADNLIRCARCNEMKECLSIATGFAGEHEPLCADCISAERLEEEDGDVIGK